MDDNSGKLREKQAQCEGSTSGKNRNYFHLSARQSALLNNRKTGCQSCFQPLALFQIRLQPFNQKYQWWKKFSSKTINKTLEKYFIIGKSAALKILLMENYRRIIKKMYLSVNSRTKLSLRLMTEHRYITLLDVRSVTVWGRKYETNIRRGCVTVSDNKLNIMSQWPDIYCHKKTCQKKGKGGKGCAQISCYFRCFVLILTSL